jgi:hypothetical protein
VEVKTLQRHIVTLATLEETGAPVISCYLNLEGGPLAYLDAVGERVRALRESFGEPERTQLDRAFRPIETYLLARPASGALGLALFSRSGEQPFFLPLEFQVPLPTWIVVNRRPSIYHLVEIKDNYDRYVILFVTEEGARILGINLGSITQEVWKSRPELRRLMGSEWTKEHYQHHRRERSRQFIREQIQIADRLMSAGGYGHLILAGPARLTAGVRQALPKHLMAKLVDVVSATAADRLPDVVAATLQPFLEHEESESLAMVDQLLKQIHMHGLAVAGTSASLTALHAGQVDVLVLAKEYQPGEGWGCAVCGFAATESKYLAGCPKCQSNQLRQFDIKEEMVRQAEQLGCGIEVVDHSDPLMQLGGAGCLLRYAAPANYREKAA